MYRHQDDLVLLRRGAGAGCVICRALVEWVENELSGLGDLPRWFGIKSLLISKSPMRRYEEGMLVFGMRRGVFPLIEPYRELRLRIIKAEEEEHRRAGERPGQSCIFI
jgi:hypothetical protein